MSDGNNGTFEIVLLEASRFLQPVADACEGGIEGFRSLIAEVGLDLDDLLADTADTQTFIDGVKASYGALRALAEGGTSMPHRSTNCWGSFLRW